MMYMHEMCFVPIYACEVQLYFTLCGHICTEVFLFIAYIDEEKSSQNPAPTLQEDYKPPRLSKLQIRNRQHPPFVSNITMSIGASTLLLGSLNLVLPKWGNKSLAQSITTILDFIVNKVGKM